MPTKRSAPPTKPASKTPSATRDDALEAVIARFALDGVEAAVLRALGEVELSLDAWRRLSELGGPNARSLGLDVAAVLERLRPDGKLRRHALVHVDATDRLAGASDPLQLDVGLVPRQPYLPVALVRYAPGVRVPSELAKRLDGTGAQIVLLDATPTQLAAQSLADGLQRAVIAGSVRGLSPHAVARLRRDADLDGAILWLVADDASIAPLLVEPIADALLVLAEVSHVDAKAPWRVRREKMTAEAGVAPVAPRNELDYVRMLAQRDAEAALGIVRPAPPPRTTVPGKIVDASVRVAESPKPEPAPAREVEGSKEPTAKAEAPKAEPPKTRPPKAEAPKPEDPAPVPAIAEADAPDGARLEVAADAAPEARARAAMQSPSAKQRIELMESLSNVKSPTVIAALRHNAKSEHAGVRAVAERIMAQLFGPNWNRSRAIAPPVQPPPSPDDKP